MGFAVAFLYCALGTMPYDWMCDTRMTVSYHFDRYRAGHLRPGTLQKRNKDPDVPALLVKLTLDTGRYGAGVCVHGTHGMLHKVLWCWVCLLHAVTGWSGSRLLSDA